MAGVALDSMHFPHHGASPPDADALVAAALDRSDTLTVVLGRAPGTRLGLAIEAVNPAFSRVFEWPPSAILGQPLDVLAAPDAEPRTLGRIADAVAARTAVQVELRTCTRGGAPRWFGMHLMPAADPLPGEPPRFVILGRDITRKLQADLEQENLQRLLAAVLLKVDAAVVILDANERVRMVNPATTRLLGHTAEAFANRVWSEFATDGERARMVALHHALYAAGPAATGAESAGTFLSADGRPVPVTIHSAVVELPDRQRFRVSTLKPAPAAPTTLVAGKIRLVGLDEVRQALGDRWPALATRAMDQAEALLRRRIHPDETLARTDDPGFVICFRPCGEAEASFRASVLARAVRAHLIGSGEDAAASATDAITAEIAVKPDEQASPVPLMAVLNHRLSARRGELESRARQSLTEALASAACRLDPVFTLPPPGSVSMVPVRVPFLDMQLAEATQQRIESALAALPAETAEEFDVNLLLLTLASERMLKEAMADGGQSCLLPIAFEVFDTRRRTNSFIDACRALDEGVRRRLLFMITGVPAGLTPARMSDITRLLAPFSKNVGIELDASQGLPFDIGQTGLRLAAVRAAALLREAEQSERAVGRLVTGLRTHKVRLLARRAAEADHERLRALRIDLVTPEREIPA